MQNIEDYTVDGQTFHGLPSLCEHFGLQYVKVYAKYRVAKAKGGTIDSVIKECINDPNCWGISPKRSKMKEEDGKKWWKGYTITETSEGFCVDYHGTERKGVVKRKKDAYTLIDRLVIRMYKERKGELLGDEV